MLRRLQRAESTREIALPQQSFPFGESAHAPPPQQGEIFYKVKGLVLNRASAGFAPVSTHTSASFLRRGVGAHPSRVSHHITPHRPLCAPPVRC